jgi:hypothetical protein
MTTDQVVREGVETESRRSFLAQLGTTLAAGLGLSLIPAAAAAAKPSRRSACGISCSPVSGSCRSACCANPPCARHLFFCRNHCDGSSYYKCYDKPCQTFCLAGQAC